MPITDRKLRVFLCHSSQDKPIVRELYQRLLAEGWIDPWLDEEKLLPGQDWDMEIEKAVEAADAVIICLSSNSVTKEGYVQRELRFVLDIADYKPEEMVFVIPVRLDDCPAPRRLRRWQYVDYFPNDLRYRSFQRLQQSLRLRFEQRYSRNIPEATKKIVEEVESKKYPFSGESSHEETLQNTINEKLINKAPVSEEPDSTVASEYKLSTICVETAGGISSPVYYKGDPIPFRKNVIFSTATDNQKIVEIHLVLGENKIAKDNISLGKYSLGEILPAPKGVPQIEIQFELTKDLVLSIVATEKSTGRVKHLGDIKVTNFSAPPVKDPLPPKSESSALRESLDGGGFSDLFRTIFESGLKTTQEKDKISYPKITDDIEISLQVTFEEAALGVTKEVEFSVYETCTNCKGSGVKMALPCEKCLSEGMSLKKTQKRIQVPAGVVSGSKIRLSGAGHVKQNSNLRGNVYVNVELIPHPFYTLENRDLFLKYPIPEGLMLKGGKLQVPTLLEQKYVELTIPPNTINGRTIRLVGHGFPNLKNPAKRGDLHVIFEGYNPNDISLEIRTKLVKINNFMKK